MAARTLKPDVEGLDEVGQMEAGERLEAALEDVLATLEGAKKT